MALVARAAAALRPASGHARALCAPAYSGQNVFYRHAPILRIAHFDAQTDEGATHFERLRAATREILTPHPMGMKRVHFLSRLKGHHDLHVDDERTTVRKLLLRMPDIAAVPVKVPGQDSFRDRVYPAYHARLCRRPRVAADYDRETPVGECSFLQLRDAVATLMEDYPRGLHRRPFLRRVRELYGHTLDAELAETLVNEMGDVATWVKSGGYAEDDKVMPVAATSAGADGYPGKGMRGHAQYRRDRPRQLAERFARWHEDVFPSRRAGEAPSGPA